MRKKIVAGNWKMNTNLPQGHELFHEINEYCNTIDLRELSVIIAPPFTHLISLCETDNRCIQLAAQNCSDKTHGAFTGEVSTSMITSSGANYVIIGHSERRKYFGETNEILKNKINLAIESGLQTIYCCGESIDERQQGIHKDIISQQIEKVLYEFDNKQIGKIIVAYEPIWAIGTGETATAEQAQEMHACIRSLVNQKFGEELANSMTIIYGGSCSAKNASELFEMKDVDGGLIGGASLKAQDFIDIINALIKS